MADESAELQSGRYELEQQLRQLEAYVGRAEASGETLPPQVHEMVIRLQEIMQALSGLASSIAPAESSTGEHQSNAHDDA